VYVDDTLFFARTITDIDNAVIGLRRLGMHLEKEDDVSGFLGVWVKHVTDGTIELLQIGLIQCILDALQISLLPTKRTPAKIGVLPADPEGEPPDCHSSVLGMMGDVQAKSRPTFSSTQS
jgi:hypothetical protein